MRLLEIGMGCSVHGGVKDLNTLAVCRSYIASVAKRLCRFAAVAVKLSHSMK